LKRCELCYQLLLDAAGRRVTRALARARSRQSGWQFLLVGPPTPVWKGCSPDSHPVCEFGASVPYRCSGTCVSLFDPARESSEAHRAVTRVLVGREGRKTTRRADRGPGRLPDSGQSSGNRKELTARDSSHVATLLVIVLGRPPVLKETCMCRVRSVTPPPPRLLRIVPPGTPNRAVTAPSGRRTRAIPVREVDD